MDKVNAQLTFSGRGGAYDKTEQAQHQAAINSNYNSTNHTPQKRTGHSQSQSKQQYTI